MSPNSPSFSSSPSSRVLRRQESCAASGRHRLRCLTYNVGCHYFSPDDAHQHIWARLGALVPKIAQVDADVLLIQELYTLSLPWPIGWGRELAWFQTQMQALGFRSCAPTDDASTPWLGLNSGLLIFAKLDMVPGSEEVHVFENNAWFQQKGFVRASFSCHWEGEPAPDLLHVICAHLDSASGAKRAAQKSAVEDAIAALLQDDLNAGRAGRATVVVAGDWNHRCTSLDKRRCPGFESMAPPGRATHKEDLELDNALVRFGQLAVSQRRLVCPPGVAQVLDWTYDSAGEELRLSDHSAILFDVALP